METKNEILADLINKARLTNNSSASRLAVSPLTASDIDLIKRELEDDKLLKELEKINSSPLAYNPFGVEFLLSDTTELLKNCIEKRTELKNLEVTLLNDSINKLLSEQKRNYEKEIAEVEKKYPDTSKILAKQIKLKKTPTTVEADDMSVTEISRYEEEIKVLNNRLKKEYEKYEDLLQDFSKDKNSGLNYLARYIELKEIYWEDFKEVFRKLKSLEVGFKTVYEIESKWPELTEDNLLNKYYIWFKNNLLKLNKLLETEIEYTVAVSLKHGRPTFQFVGENLPIHLHPPDMGVKYLSRRGNFKFNFGRSSSDLFFSKKLRLRNFGATIKLNDEVEQRTKDREYWNIIMKPPKQIDSLKTEYDLPLLSITCTNSKDLPYDNQVTTQTFFNIDPLMGWWEIYISKQGTQGNDNVPGATDGGFSKVDDILIFFKVAVLT